MYYIQAQLVMHILSERKKLNPIIYYSKWETSITDGVT